MIGHGSWPPESGAHPEYVAALVAADGEATELTERLAVRRIYEGSAVARPDAEPMDALRTIGYVEAAARNAGRRYIRHAREAGSTWHEIAGALGLTAGDGETTAEAAYTYAAGSPDSDYARRYGRSFTWTCPSCDGAIHDRGLLSGPANDEEGHGRDCIRLAEAEAELDSGRQRPDNPPVAVTALRH